MVLAVKGTAAEAAVKLCGIDALAGKTVIDTTNPIADAPPDNGVLRYFTTLDEALMERLQRLAPEANFVKAFSCVGNALMVDPDLPDRPSMFICGDDQEAKNDVSGILDQFGWDTEDMGGAAAARAIEPLCILWCIPGFLRDDWVHAYKVADLLEVQEANPFRVRAYRRAVRTLRTLDRPVEALLTEAGMQALIELRGIGSSLASAIQEVVHTGRLGLLDRLEGQTAPEDLFMTVPGIGEDLARRIHAQLRIDTLEELELAAHDGRLEEVEGFGPRRTRAVREVLGSMLSRSVRRRARRLHRFAETGRLRPAGAATSVAGGIPVEEPCRPTVDLLLDVDREYRGKAEAGTLPTIVPRRFNPAGEPWLPILHTERGPWHLTALYSNTARAHQLGRTHDWVVLYYEREGLEDQCTVVTEWQGDLAGWRVVRGRERECKTFYHPTPFENATSQSGEG